MSWNKLLYNSKTGKKLKPIIKFNGGRGAILCHKCRIIIKEDLNIKEFAGKTDLIYCDKCAIQLLKETFKH